MKKIFVRIAAISVAAIFIFARCGSNSETQGNAPRSFPMVNPPAMMGQGLPAAIYVAKNYWNPFIDSSKVFSQDTAYIGDLSDDNGGKFLKEDFEKYEVDTKYIEIKSGYRSFHSVLWP